MKKKNIVLSLAMALMIGIGTTAYAVTSSTAKNKKVGEAVGNEKTVNYEITSTAKDVTFKNGDIDMAGDLYLPENMDETKQYPAIVVTHPGGGVKEQVSAVYAKKLSEQGFIALAFDASHQGESGGEPRYLEDPFSRVEDIRCAVDYLTTLSYVNKEQIGALGICAGGGYTINAAQTEKRIKAVAGVSTFNTGGAFGDGTNVLNKASIASLEETGKKRTEIANGGEDKYGTYIPDSLEDMEGNTSNMIKEAYDYYKTPRGRHPNSTNKKLYSSEDKLMSFDAFEHIPTLLSQPLLLVAGSKAESLDFSKRAYELANCEKELFLIEGATHVDMYDKPDYVKQATDKLGEFFSENLK